MYYFFRLEPIQKSDDDQLELSSFGMLISKETKTFEKLISFPPENRCEVFSVNTSAPSFRVGKSKNNAAHWTVNELIEEKAKELPHKWIEIIEMQNSVSFGNMQISLSFKPKTKS